MVRYSAARALFLDAIRDPALITYLRGEINYCWVHFVDARPPHLTCQTLQVVQNYLPDFWRVSKPHAVNPAFIDHLLVKAPAADKDLVLITGERLAVSRRRYKSLKQQLAAYPHWPAVGLTPGAEPVVPLGGPVAPEAARA